jgi:uncharacterized protein YjiS (DUF1127 family)
VTKVEIETDDAVGVWASKRINMQLGRHFATPSAHNGALAVLSEAWSDYREAAARRALEKATREELSKLDDAALADIGVGRSEIDWTASHLSDRARG